MQKKIKKTKHNHLTKHNNRKSGGYDSQIEVVRHKELLLLEMAGEIKDIVLHPKFLLQDGFRYKNERKSVSIKYTADFQYFDIKRNITVIEELKGSYTKELADYRVRVRLFKYLIKDRDDLLFVEIVK